jgi:hypothetical protein
MTDSVDARSPRECLSERYRYGDSNPGFRTENEPERLRLFAAVRLIRSPGRILCGHLRVLPRVNECLGTTPRLLAGPFDAPGDRPARIQVDDACGDQGRQPLPHPPGVLVLPPAPAIEESFDPPPHEY